MNDIQNLNPNLTATSATQTADVQEAKTTAAPQTAQPLMSDPSVTVSSASPADLEKLVARLQNESNEQKAAVAQRRLAAILDLYAVRYGMFPAEKLAFLHSLGINDLTIFEKKLELFDLDIELKMATGDLARLEVGIETLKKAVAQAIEDGKTHRENIAKLKERLERDKDNPLLKAELACEQAALEKSDAALEKAQSRLAGAVAEAGVLSAKIQGIVGKMEMLKGIIGGLETANRILAWQLGLHTVKNLFAVFREHVRFPEPWFFDRGPSPADIRKDEEAAFLRDLGKILHEAMKQMDETLLEDIDVNRDRNV